MPPNPQLAPTLQFGEIRRAGGGVMLHDLQQFAPVPQRSIYPETPANFISRINSNQTHEPIRQPRKKNPQNSNPAIKMPEKQQIALGIKPHLKTLIHTKKRFKGVLTVEGKSNGKKVAY